MEMEMLWCFVSVFVLLSLTVRRDVRNSVYHKYMWTSGGVATAVVTVHGANGDQNNRKTTKGRHIQSSKFEFSSFLPPDWLPIHHGPTIYFICILPALHLKNTGFLFLYFSTPYAFCKTLHCCYLWVSMWIFWLLNWAFVWMHVFWIITQWPVLLTLCGTKFKSYCNGIVMFLTHFIWSKQFPQFIRNKQLSQTDSVQVE